MRISVKHNETRAGFTLLEILVSMMIFSVLMAAIGGVLAAALHLRNATNDALESAFPTENAVESIQDDLSNIVPPTGQFFAPLQTTTITNPIPGQIGPDFYISSGEIDGLIPWGNVEKLDYVLSTATNGPRRQGKDLYRAITHNLLPVNSPVTPDDVQLLLTGVDNVTITYYDGNQWQPSWDTTEQTNLPNAIKVQIQLVALSGVAKPSPLEVVVPVDLQITTNLTLTTAQ